MGDDGVDDIAYAERHSEHGGDPRALEKAPLAPLLDAVRVNCHISDARYGRNLTLCIYLLEMRELYRWESGIPLGAPVPQAEVGAWMTQREALWSTLEAADHVRLPFQAQSIDPFDVECANALLAARRLAYGAGIGRFGKPQFFLGELVREEIRDGTRVCIVGREYARDLSAAPAAMREGRIHVRREALRRWLWERVETWLSKRPDGAMRAALAAYGFAPDAQEAHAAIARMVDAESETLILHELGECRAGRILGPDWEALLAALGSRRAELFARAARDHLADCLVTLPKLVERGAAASIHFWLANLEGMRRELFPRLQTAYAAWCGGDRGRALLDTAAAGAAHWERSCMRILAVPRDPSDAADAALEQWSTDAQFRL
ncbi:MAG: hypothetical protein IT521_11550 [Burkholderiales bacterium]|nr:hypothetical protein [Burkholderiales bacterium]